MRAVVLLVLIGLLAGCAAPSSTTSPSASASMKPVPLDATKWVWRDLAPAPTPRVEQCGGNTGSKFYVVGGFVLPNQQSQPGDAGGVPTGPPTNLVEVYDAVTNSWSEGPPYPTPLEHCLATGIGDTLYVVYNVIGAGTPSCFKLKTG